jgi:hypothetical protein
VFVVAFVVATAARPILRIPLPRPRATIFHVSLSATLAAFVPITRLHG